MTKESKKTALQDSGSRDAVESSIDISKQDKTTTWEESANNKLKKISRWEKIAHKKEAAFQQT